MKIAEGWLEEKSARAVLRYLYLFCTPPASWVLDSKKILDKRRGAEITMRTYLCQIKFDIV